MNQSPTFSGVPGRRERKKAVTRRAIADSAMTLFRQKGYSNVGIREIAATADVATTTVFAHFSCKQALVFEHAEPFRHSLRAAVLRAGDGEDIVAAVEDEVSSLVEHCTAGEAAGTWQMIENNDELSSYAHQLEAEYASDLQSALQETGRLELPGESIELVSRFCMAAFTIARKAPQPQRCLHESFSMIRAALNVARKNPS